MMTRKQMINLVSAGWHLRDWFVYHPESQTQPKEKEIEAIVDALIKYGHLNGEKKGQLVVLWEN